MLNGCKREWRTDDGSVWLMQGDCLEILPQLGRVDACLTDPPYGVGFSYASHDDNLDGWRLLFASVVDWCKSNATIAVMPSCQIKQLQWIYARRGDSNGLTH